MICRTGTHYRKRRHTPPHYRKRQCAEYDILRSFGIGKTTLAQIIAGKTKRRLYKLNATTASVSDIKGMVSELDTLLAPNGILLYLDEIQYFNKKQQQSLWNLLKAGK